MHLRTGERSDELQLLITPAHDRTSGSAQNCTDLTRPWSQLSMPTQFMLPWALTCILPSVVTRAITRAMLCVCVRGGGEGGGGGGGGRGGGGRGAADELLSLWPRACGTAWSRGRTQCWRQSSVAFGHVLDSGSTAVWQRRLPFAFSALSYTTLRSLNIAALCMRRDVRVSMMPAELQA